jgi:hypothetical protein
MANVGSSCFAFRTWNSRYHTLTAVLLKGGSTTLENTYKDEIFTKRVRAGKRTYFFDVKSTKSEKDFYITITESKRVGEEEYEKHKIFLYKEDFDKFSDALDETVDYVQGKLLVHAEPGNGELVVEKQA